MYRAQRNHWMWMLAVAACSLVASGSAFAIDTAADGDWGTGATWVGATEPGAFDAAAVLHNVSVTQAGEVANVVDIGGGTLTISGGDLTLTNSGFPGSNNIGVFGIGAGVVIQTGGTWTTPVGMDITIGGSGVGGSGAYTINGGTVNVGGILSIAFGGSNSGGTMTIDGAGSTISAGDFGVGGNNVAAFGELVIRPTANGAPGLTTIAVTNIVALNTVGPKILTLDPQYTVQMGDSWVVATAGGTIFGTFDTVNTPAGVTTSLSTAGSQVTLTVTGVPVLAPAANYWGIAILAGLIALASLVFVRRTRVV